MVAQTHHDVPCVITARGAGWRETAIDLFRPTTRHDERATYAHLALAPARKAVVFVHGFAGRALQTWTQFPHLLQGNPKAADYDLFFYEYDSFTAQVGDISFAFARFLKKLAANPAVLVNRGLSLPQQRAAFTYERIVLIAHSLGAVVTRRLLLDAHTNGEPWVAKTRFVLFAPADRGALRGHLVSEALAGVPFGSLGGAAIQGAFPAVDQIKQGGKYLEDLRNDTLEVTANNAAPHLKAARVLFAEHESVTLKQKFLLEEKADDIPETTHTSVCKPVDASNQAVTELLLYL